MKTITEQFGERLKKIRTQKSLSQEQLSYLADIDRSYISDVERGARNISLENIYKLASALNIPPYLLLLECQSQYWLRLNISHRAQTT